MVGWLRWIGDSQCIGDLLFCCDGLRETVGGDSPGPGEHGTIMRTEWLDL